MRLSESDCSIRGHDTRERIGASRRFFAERKSSDKKTFSAQLTDNTSVATRNDPNCAIEQMFWQEPQPPGQRVKFVLLARASTSQNRSMRPSELDCSIRGRNTRERIGASRRFFAERKSSDKKTFSAQLTDNTSVATRNDPNCAIEQMFRQEPQPPEQSVKIVLLAGTSTFQNKSMRPSELDCSIRGRNTRERIGASRRFFAERKSSDKKTFSVQQTDNTSVATRNDPNCAIEQMFRQEPQPPEQSVKIVLLAGTSTSRTTCEDRVLQEPQPPEQRAKIVLLAEASTFRVMYNDGVVLFRLETTSRSLLLNSPIKRHTIGTSTRHSQTRETRKQTK